MGGPTIKTFELNSLQFRPHCWFFIYLFKDYSCLIDGMSINSLKGTSMPTRKTLIGIVFIGYRGRGIRRACLMQKQKKIVKNLVNNFVHTPSRHSLAIYIAFRKSRKLDNAITPSAIVSNPVFRKKLSIYAMLETRFGTFQAALEIFIMILERIVL
jgi:hypothetical protein